MKVYKFGGASVKDAEGIRNISQFLLDEGAESAVYTITGKMGMEQYKRMLGIFRKEQPIFHDPFEDRQMKAVFSSIDYDSRTGEFEFVLVEDAEQDEIMS